MKRSERRVSLGCIQSDDTNPFTSEAIRVGRRDASNLVLGPTPLTPRVRLPHASATVLPTGETRPSPVTTTLRFDMLGGAAKDAAPGRGETPGGYCLTWPLT